MNDNKGPGLGCRPSDVFLYSVVWGLMFGFVEMELKEKNVFVGRKKL